MYTIDKSAFTAEELEQYEALIAKAKVDPEADEDDMEDDIPDDDTPEIPPKDPAKKKCGKKPAKKAEVDEVEDAKKSAPEVPDFVKAAIAKSEEFITRSEKQEQAAIAKKYDTLVADTDALAEQLYNLKKSNPEMYDTCITMLDSQMKLLEKSGPFAEIGKSGSGHKTAGGSEAKAEAKAQEIMKSQGCDYVTAIAKAYEDPAIMAECDAEYFGRR